MPGIGHPKDPLGKPVVMDKVDYRYAARSHAGRLLFAIAVGVGGAYLSTLPSIPFGMAPCVLIALGFGYGIGGKFFADSDRYFWHSARNYRRVKRGREPLGADQSHQLDYTDDFGRG